MRQILYSWSTVLKLFFLVFKISNSRWPFMWELIYLKVDYYPLKNFSKLWSFKSFPLGPLKIVSFPSPTSRVVRCFVSYNSKAEIHTIIKLSEQHCVWYERQPDVALFLLILLHLFWRESLVLHLLLCLLDLTQWRSTSSAFCVHCHDHRVAGGHSAVWPATGPVIHGRKSTVVASFGPALTGFISLAWLLVFF